MKLMSSLRKPCRSRRIVGTGISMGMSEASLARGVVWTQLVVLVLCAARVRADLLGGTRTIEGGLALGLLVVLAASLFARAIAWALRRRGGGPRLPPPTPAWTIGSSHAHAK